MSNSSMPPHRSIYAEDPLMQPLIVEFTTRLAGHVKEIRKAVAAEDSAALHRILHQLRGSGQSYGFSPISNHAAVADEKIKAKQPLSECYSDINALIDYIEQIENYQSL